MKEKSLIKMSLLGIMCWLFAGSVCAVSISKASPVMPAPAVKVDVSKVTIKGDLPDKKNTVSKCFYEKTLVFDDGSTCVDTGTVIITIKETSSHIQLSKNSELTMPTKDWEKKVKSLLESKYRRRESVKSVTVLLKKL